MPAAQTKAHFALLGTNLFFAINYSAIKYLTVNHLAGPFGINIIRIGVSLILFWILFLFKPRQRFPNKKEMIVLIVCALTAIALNQMLFIKGLSLTFPIHASLLTLITPILITLFAAQVLKEKLNSKKIIGLSLGIAGALLLIGGRETGAPGDNIILGDILVILSSVAYTFYFILVKPLMEKYSPVHIVRLIFTFGFFLIVPFCVGEFKEIAWQSFHLGEWALLFLIVIPGTFVAYIFNVYGIKILSASAAGAYIYSQPVFAVAISVIFLKEHFSVYKIIAALLIFAGVYLTNQKKQIDNKEVAPLP
jgi:drug/metabolite transporter (DMT)-like permease